DVQQPLVGAHLEVLARILVLVRRTDDAVDVLLGGQRHRTDDAGAGAGHRLDDLARRCVDRLMVIGLEPDADLLSRHACSPLLAGSRRPEGAASFIPGPWAEERGRAWPSVSARSSVSQ